MSPILRKTRFVCISDTHGASPKDGAFKLPKGDVLVHAGDLTNQGTYSELQKTITWLDAAPFECKIVIAGNHDVTLDAPFYAAHGTSFHNQAPQSPSACLNLLTATDIVYLDHATATVRLSSPAGPRTAFKVFGSPYSPARSGKWAFTYGPDEAEHLWAAVPADVDVVVTHTPVSGHLDLSPKWGVAGCEALLKRLWAVKPLLAVAGHVHERRGAEVVRWGSGFAGREEAVAAWGGRGILDVSHAARASETVLVNAAIMARSHGAGAKRFNQPIVVDVELPAWDEEHEMAEGLRAGTGQEQEQEEA